MPVITLALGDTVWEWVRKVDPPEKWVAVRVQGAWEYMPERDAHSIRGVALQIEELVNEQAKR